MQTKNSRDSMFAILDSYSKNILEFEFKSLPLEIHSDSQVINKIEKFMYEAEQVGIDVFESAKENINDLIQKLIADIGLKKIGVDLRLKEIITSERVVEVDISKISDKMELNDFDTFVEYCEIACCDTATLFFVNCRYDSNYQSLLPAYHIVVLNKKNIFSYQCCFEKLSYYLSENQNIVAITGPSRTADIEKVLVKGVHGPKKLIVFLID